MQYYTDDANNIYAYDDDYTDIPAGLEPISEEQARQILASSIPLDDAKRTKRAEIERDRDAQATAPVTVHGRTWQADERSQRLLAGAIQMHGLTGALPAVWRDAANNDMPVTDIAQLVAIAAAIAQQTEAAYAASWTRKAALDAAQTVEEVNAA